MYGYQQYLDPNRSLLNSGMQYQYGSGFPDHLKQWQQNGYDTSGIDYFSRQNASHAAPPLPQPPPPRPSYGGPGIGWNGWGNGGRPVNSGPPPGDRPIGYWGGGGYGQSQRYPGRVTVGRGQRRPRKVLPLPPQRYFNWGYDAVPANGRLHTPVPYQPPSGGGLYKAFRVLH